MSSWRWFLLVGLVLVVLYLVVLATLVAAGRRGDASAMARFIPDCLVLFGRLARDERLGRGERLLLVGLIAYLASPLDLVPDVLPVIGQLDDAMLAALVLRRVLRSVGRDVVAGHWPGPPASLTVLLRLSGVEPTPS